MRAAGGTKRVERILLGVLLISVSTLACSQGGPPTMPAEAIRLPETVDGWRLAGPPRRIDAATIFDYMDGAGELYVSYHFDHLLVYEYRNEGGNDILVEIYRMKGARDAFGLLSLDWSGEAVALGGAGTGEAGHGAVVPAIRALYGEGLLRAWSDDLYVRILASRVGPGVREAVLRLGRAIAAGRKGPAPPALVGAVAPEGPSWTIRPDRTAYFYSHLVLNSIYYLSHENILDLGADTEALMVTFEQQREAEAKRSARLLVIAYPGEGRAAAALEGFVKAYLADKAGQGGFEAAREGPGFVEVEDGWLGFARAGRHLALAFQCPDRDSAREVLGRARIK